MARRYNGRYQSRAGAIVAAIVGTLVTCALAVGAWVHWDAVSGFFKDIALMFEIAQEKVEQEKAEREEQASGFIFDDNGFEEGIFLMSARIEPNDYAAYEVVETAESAYTITATIEPANATQTALNWSVEWVNGASEFATGKTVTEYVTVSPYGEDGAVVSCLQPFGAQIAVKVTVAENTALRASCTCDYAKKITQLNSVNLYGNATAKVVSVDVENGFVSDDFSGNMGKLFEIGQYNGDFSAYTINDTFSKKFYVKFNDSFINECKKTSLNGYLNASETWLDLKYLQLSQNAVKYAGVPDNLVEQFNDRLGLSIRNLGVGAVIGTLKMEVIGEYSTNIFEFEIRVGDGWEVAATNVALSDKNLTF